MTEIELLKKRWQELIDRCPLERGEVPLVIGNISYTQFSIARYEGGCRYQNKVYIYEPLIDALIREDVHEWARKEWNPKQQPAKPIEQMELFAAEKE